MSKKEYSTPELDITKLEGDIITTSPTGNGEDNDVLDDEQWGQ